MNGQQFSRFIKPILFAAAIISFNNINAQDTDSSSIKKISNDFKSWNLPTKQLKTFSYKSFVVPAFMIAYGFTALKSDGLEDWNQALKEEIWNDHPHKKVTIDNYLQFAPAVAVYGLNIAGIKGKHNFRDRTILYLLSSTLNEITVHSLKNITKQQRPDASSYQSFPSGHTAQAFASAEFLRQEYKDISPWYGVAGYAAATATGLLRMYNNKHWLSDVVAGAGIGIASTKLVYWIYPAISKRLFKDKPLHTFISPYYNGSSGGVSVVHNFHG